MSSGIMVDCLFFHEVSEVVEGEFTETPFTTEGRWIVTHGNLLNLYRWEVYEATLTVNPVTKPKTLPC